MYLVSTQCLRKLRNHIWQSLWVWGLCSLGGGFWTIKKNPAKSFYSSQSSLISVVSAIMVNIGSFLTIFLSKKGPKDTHVAFPQGCTYFRILKWKYTKLLLREKVVLKKRTQKGAQHHQPLGNANQSHRGADATSQPQDERHQKGRW